MLSIIPKYNIPIYIKPILLMLSSFIPLTSYANGVIFGNEQDGQLKVSGTVRAKYVYDFDTEPTTSKLSFSDAVLWLDYNSPKWFGRFDYRVYEYYGHLGDASWLTDAWVGYKFNDQHQLIAGVNPVPFGLGRYWGSTFYEGIGNTAGWEDVHNLGVKYNYNDGINEAQIAYYPTDAGNYVGHSKDAKRFSINLVNADDGVVNGTNTREKNAVVVRAAHQFTYQKQDKKISTQLGASGWYSQIENKRSGKNGDRKLWSVFSNSNYNNWNLQLLAGHQDIDNADNDFKKHVTVGGFDSSFNEATEGNIYSAELSYSIPQQIGPFTAVRPYLNYSSYQKSESGFKNSSRIIPGLAFTYQKVTVQAELLIGKHDPYIGDANGLAEGGTDGWNKRAFISIGYYF